MRLTSPSFRDGATIPTRYTCSGKGAHRYVFALYATDAPLDLDSSASADDIRSAIAKHALASGRLTGRFSR